MQVTVFTQLGHAFLWKCDMSILEDNAQTLMSANQNMINTGVTAMGNLAEPVAKLWCRSFGVADAQSVDRLKKLLEVCAHEAFGVGASFQNMQALLDKHAEKIIREWFAYILGQDIPSSSRTLAVLRLAFLDCNYEGKWSASFLTHDFCVQELSAELGTVMIMPTPQANRREMTRQSI